MAFWIPDTGTAIQDSQLFRTSPHASMLFVL